MEIVTASEKHIPEILELWKEFMDFHKDIDTRFPLSVNASVNQENHLRASLQSENAQLLVAIDKSHVIAYSLSEINKYPPIFTRDTYGFISDMAVKSNYRRKGIGEEMLARIHKWFDSRKIDRIELNVAARNQVGYPFWRKHGFKDYAHRLYLDR